MTSVEMLIPDDITSVEFHAQQQDRLVTGGTDGLVNVLDLSKSDEEEALVTSYNSEDSVASVMWREEEVVVRTHTEAVQTWSPATSRTVRRSRREVAEVMRRAVEDHVYMAGVGVEEGEVRLLAGSRFLPSPCLRSLALTQHGLQPRADFLRPGPSVRSSLHLRHRDHTVLTGGDDGVIRVWSLRESGSLPDPHLDTGGKIGNSATKVRKKPYTK